MQQDFSVLISVYFRETPAFMRQSLDSVFDQTVKPSEVVLVEDGPLTQELYSVIEEYSKRWSKLKIIKLDNNLGLGMALNEGLKHCSYDLVARMDTDDICKPDRFEKQLSKFRQDEKLDVVSAWIDEFEEDITTIKSTRKLPEIHSQIYQYGKSRCPVNHPVVMFRKNAVIAAGGYQHMPLFEDYYLWVRMLVNGAKFYNIQESLLYFRTSDAMFRRRGGRSYAKTEITFLWTMYKLGYVGLVSTIKNFLIRYFVRIMPNKMRQYVYKNLLRK